MIRVLIATKPNNRDRSVAWVCITLYSSRPAFRGVSGIDQFVAAAPDASVCSVQPCLGEL